MRIPALDRHWRQLFLEAGPRGDRDPAPVAPPLREVRLVDRAVRVHVAARHLDERVLSIRFLPAAEPSLRADEGHALTAIRTEAEPAVARGGLEHPAPPGPEGFPQAFGA